MRSLRTQISLAFMLVILITVSVISFASNLLIRQRFEAYVQGQQDARTGNIVSSLGLQYDSAADSWSHDAVYALGMYSLKDGFIIKVYDRSGATVWDAEHHDMARCREIMDEIMLRMAHYGTSGSFMTQEYPLMQNGQTVGSVSIRFFSPFFFSESDVVFLNALNLLLTVIGFASLILSFAVSGLLARRIARPITKTADVAKRIAKGHYDIHFEGQSRTRELYNLMTSFNELSDALARQETIRKQMTADVAHELRTPLATLGSHLEAMIEGVWQPTPERLRSCHEEILRLGNLVADLERLERAERAEQGHDRMPVEMLGLIRSVCSNFDTELAKKDLQLSISGDTSFLSADLDAMSGVITNLMSNAVKYNPRGGQIRITVQDADHETRFMVEDNGPGIPEDELPYVFERFFRADKSRNRSTGGAGIGLAIVRTTVMAHGGTVSAENRPDGGCRFTVALPKTT